MKASIIILFSVISVFGYAQPSAFPAQPYTRFVLYQERVKLDRQLREQTIRQTFSMPLDSTTEYRYEGACWAISQFQVDNEEVRAGLDKMMAAYSTLSNETRRSLLEAVFAVYPSRYCDAVRRLLPIERTPKLFAMCAVYLDRCDSTATTGHDLLITLTESFAAYDSLPILDALAKYLQRHRRDLSLTPPSLAALFTHQRTHGRKMVYSLQRGNRDYPGLAIIQQADGRFMRHADGRLMVFQQLARSASDLPYFLTNGNTPQGAYTILGTAVSNNHFIGPTPTLQLAMPGEIAWTQFFHLPAGHGWDSTIQPHDAYLTLFPPSWKKFASVDESFAAGRIGRTEIIAHGTTIDPAYFKDKPFYPLTPTLGCPCAREEWNITTGRPTFSEQANLIQEWRSTTGQPGYLIVLNLDNKHAPVTRNEIERFVNEHERTLGKNRNRSN